MRGKVIHQLVVELNLYQSFVAQCLWWRATSGSISRKEYPRVWKISRHILEPKI